MSYSNSVRWFSRLVGIAFGAAVLTAYAQSDSVSSQGLARNFHGTVLFQGQAMDTEIGPIVTEDEETSNSTRRHALGGPTGQDTVICELGFPQKWGVANNIAAYSIATRVGNNGDDGLTWILESTLHPLIPQHIFRYDGVRIEQIGMSWVKHASIAFGGSGSGCELQFSCQPGGNSDLMQPGCTDVYSSSWNGGFGATSLGPRSEVNAFTGEFPWPPAPADISVPETIRRRIQVHVDDINPVLNPGAIYIAEAILMHFEDAEDGNQFNNNSWRQMEIESTEPDGAPELTFGDNPMHLREAAIFAWGDLDPGVKFADIDVPGEGRFHVGFRVTDNSNGTWHYQYAVYNLNSDVSARSFSVPLFDDPGLVVLNVEFSDVDYHSGDGIGGVNFDGTDWPATITPGSDLTWQTDTFAQNPNANALRWGTMYAFGFDANATAIEASVTLGLFKPNPDSAISTLVLVPGEPVEPCQGDAECDDGHLCNGVETCNLINGLCENVPDDALCDDMLFCNGVETCHPHLGCLDGPDPDCNDFIDCTADSCNGATDSCDHIPNDALCDDDMLFCTGVETCDALMGCQSSGDPCPGQVCNEIIDQCVDCLDNFDCDDGDDCTTDLCSAQVCEFPPRLYGDANNNGEGNVTDVVCAALVVFQDATVCSGHEVSLDEIDIAPGIECGDEQLNVTDVVAHALAAFQDAVDECCGD